MKAKCVKSDPLEWVKVGEIYNYTIYNGVYLINGLGFSQANFNKSFEILK